ncbi:hypothetical protein E4U31_006984 [Claviceps sp. LM219 group G6]|nr:hypothetical protein E4U31_006984 [Claviceps sp. LM219 group G6]
MGNRHNTDSDATNTTNININRAKTINTRTITTRIINTGIISNRIITRPIITNISTTQTSINHIKITTINISQIKTTQIKATNTCMEQPSTQLTTKTAIELARRSEPKQEFVPEDHLEDVDALAANALAFYPSNQMSSSVDNSLLTPVFLDGGPTVPMLPPDGVDNMFAINAPLLDYRDMLLGSGPDIDIRNWYTSDWDAGTVMRQELIGQQGGGIMDLTVTSAGLPPVERQDMAMTRIPKDLGETDAKESAPVRMIRVRKGLAELETCLRAHVKDQLLQMRECH